jgi:hypothetical protein
MSVGFCNEGGRRRPSSVPALYSYEEEHHDLRYLRSSSYGAALALALAVAPVHAGSIILSATNNATPGYVTLDVTITDTGGAPDCTAFALIRRAILPCGAPVQIECIPRQGASQTLQFQDTVARNTSYMYEVQGHGGPLGLPICGYRTNSYEFQQAFDPHTWGFPILAFLTVGPNPTPIAHGTLLQPFDAAATFNLDPCPGSCPTGFDAGAGTSDLNQYIGAGTAVDLYGTVQYCCNCCGFLLDVTSVAPRPCEPTAVSSRSWTNVKHLYQDASN